MKSGIREIILSPQASIVQAMETMERKPKDHRPAGIVLVADTDGRLLGVVTDGDIRRAILAGIKLDQSIEHIMTRDPIVVREREVEGGSYTELLAHVQRSRRMMDPTSGKILVIDDEDRVTDILSLLDVLRLQSVRTQTICVVGMGYVGLTLAVAFADVGLIIYGMEVDADVRRMLQAGDLHFYEADLDRALRAHLGKRVFIGSELDEARADIYVICVGTPVDEKGKPLLDDVESASRSVATVLKRGDLVALRSTVPIGTSRRVVLPILEGESGLIAGRDFDFVFSPERSVAGNALSELRTLPQIIGSVNGSGLERASRLFREVTPSVVTVASLEEAEAVKLLNNAFRDHVFAFSNEVALICERWGLDTARVIRAANEGYPRDPIPQASPGVGGLCLRKDPYLFLASAQYVGYHPRIIGQSRLVNEYIPSYIAENVIRFFGSKGKDPLNSTVFVVGFAFKGEPETSDMRDSSSLALVDHLRPKVRRILGYDPVVSKDTLTAVPGVECCSVEDGFRGTDCVVIMNNHRSYLRWPIHELLESLNRPALFLDGWRLFESSDVCKVENITYGALGIQYFDS